MSSLKEPVATPDEYELRESKRRKQYTRIAFLMLAPVVVVVAVIIVAWRWSYNPEPLLQAARKELAQAASQDDFNLQRNAAAEAESLLNDYLFRGGKQVRTARLLLAA